MRDFKHVFEELMIRGITLKNRIQYAPMVPDLVSMEGEAVTDMVNFIEGQARTGVAYITIGDAQIDYARGRNEGEVRADKDQFAAGLYRLAEAAHRHGALLSIELSHAGAGANPNKNPERAISPSGVRIPSPKCSPNPKVMDRGDMDMVRDLWAACAKRCVDAGFDMIMIHSAHQNLLCEFVSPVTNTRTDQYGGSLENRMRYPLEVIKAIREAVGGKVILEMRVSGREEIPNGLMEDEVIEYARRAQEYVDIMHVSRGSIFEPNASMYTIPTYFKPAKLNTELSAKFKQALDIPVAVPGNIYTIEDAEEILAKGQADIIAMVRSIMADPDIIQNAILNQTARTRPCLRCMECARRIMAKHPIRCAVNPLLGRETELKTIRKAETKKKVVVVGGGVAGMMATQLCTQRGHDVILFEKSPKLGGLLHDASAIEPKHLMRRYLDWDIRTTLSSNADVRLNTEATVEEIHKENPDAVILATGSQLLRPDIPGIDKPNVKFVNDVDHKRVPVGHKVAICGGGISGIECAVELGKDGKDVTVVDMIPEETFGKELMFANYWELVVTAFREYGIKKMGNSKIVEFADDGVVVETADGLRKIEADTIVIALGVKPYNPLAKEIKRMYPFSTYIVGDCTGAGRGDILKGNHDAFYAAVEI